MENDVLIHLATLPSNSRRFCEEPDVEEAGSTEKEPCSDKNSEEAHQNADEPNVVDQIVWHAGSSLGLKDVVQ